MSCSMPPGRERLGVSPDTCDNNHDNGYHDDPQAAVVPATTTASATRSGGHAAPVLSFTHVQKTTTINCGG